MVLGLEIIGCLGAGRSYDVQCALMEAASNHLETPLMGWEGGIFDPGRFVPDPLGSLSAQLGAWWWGICTCDSIVLSRSYPGAEVEKRACLVSTCGS